MFACCTLAPVGHRPTDSSSLQRGRTNSNAVGRVILSSPAAVTEVSSGLGKPRRSGSVLSPTNRRISVSVQSPVVLQVGTGLAAERLAAVRSNETARSVPASRRLRRPSAVNQRDGSRSTRVASIVVPPILPVRSFRDPVLSPSRGSPQTGRSDHTGKRDLELEEDEPHEPPESEKLQIEDGRGAEDDEGPLRTFRPSVNARLSPSACCWRTSTMETSQEQLIENEVETQADLTSSPLPELDEELPQTADENLPEMLAVTRPLTPVVTALDESPLLDAIPEASPDNSVTSPEADTPGTMTPGTDVEAEADLVEKVQGRMRTRVALDVGTEETEKATVRKASLSAKPSSDDTPLANPSSKPATKRKAKAPPGAKSAGAVGGLVTKDKNKMVDLLSPKDKKNLLGACTFVRNSIEVDPATDSSVVERDKAFLLWLFLFAVKTAVSGKQHPVATVCAHASDHAAGDLVTDKAKKAAPKVHFLIKAICKPVLAQLESPDPKLSADEVATDIERSIGVLMGEKPAGWKDRLGYIRGAVSTWSWQKARQLAETNAGDFEKYSEKLWDGLDSSRQAGQTGFQKATQEMIDLFKR